mgnify:CR=1 FL=1
MKFVPRLKSATAGPLAVMLAGMLLAGLSQAASAKEFLRMATLGPGTTPYMLSTMFATEVNRRMDGKEIQVNATGKGTQHAIEAAKGDLDIFVTAAIVQRLMSSGSAMYAKVDGAPEMAKKLRLMFMFPAGMYHFAVYEDSGIKAMADIKGKKVFVGPKGSAINNVVKAIIKATTGYEAGTDYDAVEVSFDAGGAAFQDRRVDVYANVTNPPSPVLSQVALSNEIRLLDLGDISGNEEMKKLYANRPGRYVDSIPAGIYGKNQVNDKDVPTLGAYMGIATREGLSDEDVYRMLQIFWDAVEASKTQAPWLAEITMDKAFASANMPLHPGAVRYYREKGLEIPAALLPAQ